MGSIAPPTIIITNNEEPCDVYSSRPAIARVKIFDHIIELNNPMHNIDHIASLPCVKIPSRSNAITKKAKIVNVLAGRDFPNRNAM